MGHIDDSVKPEQISRIAGEIRARILWNVEYRLGNCSYPPEENQSPVASIADRLYLKTGAGSLEWTDEELFRRFVRDFNESDRHGQKDGRLIVSPYHNSIIIP